MIDKLHICFINAEKNFIKLYQKAERDLTDEELFDTHNRLLNVCNDVPDMMDDERSINRLHATQLVVTSDFKQPSTSECQISPIKNEDELRISFSPAKTNLGIPPLKENSIFEKRNPRIDDPKNDIKPKILDHEVLVFRNGYHFKKKTISKQDLATPTFLTKNNECRLINFNNLTIGGLGKRDSKSDLGKNK